MAERPFKTKDGIKKVYNTPKPNGTTTYFSGAGDDVVSEPKVIGDGPKLLFNLTPGDALRSVTIEYTELVYVKDGYVIFTDAPLGAYLTAEILDPSDVVVGALGRKIPLLGNGRITMDSNDRASIPTGLKIKITVHNASGTAPEDPAAAFKVAGMLEMFRVNT